MDQEEVREKLQENRKMVLGIGFAVILLVLAGFYASDFSNVPAKALNETDESSNSSVQLTKYQRNYVDCPKRYLELCTKMSKKPTEEVVFQKAENGKLYLELPRSNRTMIARIGEGNQTGYLIRIQE